jgi:hypothetical protein
MCRNIGLGNIHIDMEYYFFAKTQKALHFDALIGKEGLCTSPG